MDQNISEVVRGEDSDLSQRIRQSSEEHRALKISHIETWAQHSPYATRDLQTLMQGLRTRTFGDQQHGGYQKAVLCCDLGDLLEREGTCCFPLIYLASADDIAFAIGLRFREIHLVDPDLAQTEVIEEIRATLSEVGHVTSWVTTATILSVMVDFGHGKEKVAIVCHPQSANDFSPPTDVLFGGLISYQNGGNTPPMHYPRLCQQLVEGGIIYDNLPSPIEELAYQPFHEQGDAFAPSDPETLAASREAVRQLASQYGFLVEFPFSGFSTPYYRRVGPLKEGFAAEMRSIVEAKKAQNNAIAAAVGALRAAPSARPVAGEFHQGNWEGPEPGATFPPLPPGSNYPHPIPAPGSPADLEENI